MGISGMQRRNTAFAMVRRKVYRCPDCGAEIALKDIDVRTDMMLCRSCGKRHSLKRQVQREASQKEPGEPPRGVIVQAGVVTSDGIWEDRIVYLHRSLPLPTLHPFVPASPGILNKKGRCALRRL